MGYFSHIDSEGKIRMVDVSKKKETLRAAQASGNIILNKEIIDRIKNKSIQKGDVLAAARIAGINAAKKTWELIPLCHQIRLTNIDVNFEVDENENKIIATSSVKGFDKTGVEMEAITAATVSLITIYDMCKSFSKDMVIGGIKLSKKTGGKSNYVRDSVKNSTQ
ncbi:MAG: cyclic pyranopterin monophosphate synthase MoaC [Actinobacteria bacterium]|nr:cyclic pyranopterin monophosphate synthase MoaC [Actinomycetota bacterium]